MDITEVILQSEIFIMGSGINMVPIGHKPFSEQMTNPFIHTRHASPCVYGFGIAEDIKIVKTYVHISVKSN